MFSGYHDEYLPSIYGGRINGEEVGRQHKKGLQRMFTHLSALIGFPSLFGGDNRSLDCCAVKFTAHIEAKQTP